MLTDGDVTPIDDDPSYPMELPEWADEKRIKKYVKWLTRFT